MLYKKIIQFIYLNTYAFILLGLGILFFFIPLYKLILPPWFGQVIVILICFIYSIGLFSQYRRRLRVLALLLHRNRKEFRPDTFRLVMQKFCGRLLAKEALRKLGQINEYKELKEKYCSHFRNSNKGLLEIKQ